MIVVSVCVSITGLGIHFEITGTADDTFSYCKEDFLADYDMLWEILEENYFYFPYLEKQGVDIAALKADTRKQLESRISDIDGFYYLLESMFRRMQNFAHLNVVEPAVYAVYQKYYNGEEAPDSGWKRALQNPKTPVLYAYLEENAVNGVMSMNHGKKNGKTQNREDFPPVDASYDADRKAVLFRVISFDDRICERDAHFIDTYLASLGNVEIEHIVFDLSGNGGGNDRYWQQNIVAPFGGNYEWDTWCYLRDTALMRDYYFHDLKPEPVENISGHEVPDAVTELGLTHYFTLSWQLSFDAALGDEIRSARRWVIVDGRVYSAADSFSAFCRETGWATVVGSTTLGDGKGTSPVLAALPETGLLIRFSGLAVESPDGALNAIIGTRPDVQIGVNDGNAYDVICQVIEEGSK